MKKQFNSISIFISTRRSRFIAFFWCNARAYWVQENRAPTIFSQRDHVLQQSTESEQRSVINLNQVKSYFSILKVHWIYISKLQKSAGPQKSLWLLGDSELELFDFYDSKTLWRHAVLRIFKTENWLWFLRLDNKRLI